MRMPSAGRLLSTILFLAAILDAPNLARSKQAGVQDPLPSWSEGASKKSIVDFVARVTKEGGPDFVPVDQRIATFDNDGTLWVEQPIYTQFIFLMDRMRSLAPHHPEWKTTQPYAAAVSGDLKALAASGEIGLVKLFMVTHAGTTTEEFPPIVENWLATAKQKRFDKQYTECVYQPMIELLAYMRANGFKTYIVSGGGVDFMRVFSEKVYGVPPEQVVGSSLKTKFEMRDGEPIILRLDEIGSVDDGPGKPENIDRMIGRRPIAAFGNSDGDLPMLQWTAAGPGPRFMLLVHHTDAEREYAYDRHSPVGRLDKAWDEAVAKGWTVVDMKNDWKQIFAFQK
jgi:phosphoserine phosphatase